MGTGKYPEEIVEKVAKAIRGATDDGADRTEDYAIAVLDALGLTVTEEWGMQHPLAGYIYSGYVSEQHMHSDRARLSGSLEWSSVCRTVLRAETPWEVVDQ